MEAATIKVRIMVGLQVKWLDGYIRRNSGVIPFFTAELAAVGVVQSCGPAVAGSSSSRSRDSGHKSSSSSSSRHNIYA